MDYEGLLELVKQRRSFRRFKPEPVPDEYIVKIIEVARWAPSGANSQPWEFIVIKKDELKWSIEQLIEEQAVLTRKMDMAGRPDRAAAGAGAVSLDAPVLIMLCGDPRTIEKFPIYTQYQRGRQVFESSLATAFIYMHLAAASLGLGSRWISATRNFYVQHLTKVILGIPKELEIYDTMALGYPASAPAPRFVRAREEMVHYDYYDQTRLTADGDVQKVLATIRGR